MSDLDFSRFFKNRGLKTEFDRIDVRWEIKKQKVYEIYQNSQQVGNK